LQPPLLPVQLRLMLPSVFLRIEKVLVDFEVAFTV
jgi:hypothetical protein